jgi:isoleucyl-tRNA synthetase
VPDELLTGLDRWILHAFSQLEDYVSSAYERYEFHAVYQRISQFAAVELSGIYHDVVKDRLYTDAPQSPRRRSTQTALYQMLASLCRMLGPILSFTADEAWEFVPGRAADSDPPAGLDTEQLHAIGNRTGNLEDSVCDSGFRLAGVGEIAPGENHRQGP